MALSQNPSDSPTQIISPTLWVTLKEHFRQAAESDQIDDNTIWQQPTSVSVCKLVESALVSSGSTQTEDLDTVRSEIERYVTRILTTKKKTFTWKDMSLLVEELKPLLISADQSERIHQTITETGLDLALRQSIERRVEDKQFPPVMPAELKDRDQQAVAENLLGLVDEHSKDKLLTYILSNSRTETTEENGSADWILGLYETMYKHVRIWVFTETLRSHVFPHRHHNQHFLPLVPPQILKSTEERANAVDVARKITPDILPLIKEALWHAWGDYYTVLEMVGIPAEKGFTTFLEELYYSVLSKQLQGLRSW